MRVPDGYLYGRPEDEMRRVLQRARPDVLGISVHQAVNLEGARTLSRLAKDASAGRTVTVAGGVYPSVSRSAVLERCPDVDYAIQGEAEESFVTLVRGLATDKVDESAVDGLIRRGAAGIEVAPKESYIQDLDDLPFPARDLVDIRRFMNMRLSVYGIKSAVTVAPHEPVVPASVLVLQHVDDPRQEVAAAVPRERARESTRWSTVGVCATCSSWTTTSRCAATVWSRSARA